jgi:hypothetical protein
LPDILIEHLIHKNLFASVAEHLEEVKRVEDPISMRNTMQAHRRCAQLGDNDNRRSASKTNFSHTILAFSDDLK